MIPGVSGDSQAPSEGSPSPRLSEGLLDRRLPMTIQNFEKRVQLSVREIAGDLLGPRHLGRIAAVGGADLPSRECGPQSIGCYAKGDRLAIEGSLNDRLGDPLLIPGREQRAEIVAAGWAPPRVATLPLDPFRHESPLIPPVLARP